MQELKLQGPFSPSKPAKQLLHSEPVRMAQSHSPLALPKVEELSLTCRGQVGTVRSNEKVKT